MPTSPPPGYPRISLGKPDPDLLYVSVDDLDAHHARAEIIEEPADQPYGDRRSGAVDPEGHRWYFAVRNASS